MNDRTMPGTGVLIVGFGAPESLDDVRPFMCELMGREPSDEAVGEACMKYLAIGGSSPLPEIAESIRQALAEQLAIATNSHVPVLVGMRYTQPSIPSAIETFAQAGVGRVVMCALSPFESAVTHEAYREEVQRALAEHPGMELVEAPAIGLLDAFAELSAASAMSALEQLDPPTGALVVFTAHSLPLADLAAQDLYVTGLKYLVDRIAVFLKWNPGREGVGEPVLSGVSTYGNLASEPQPWILAYQSKGRRPGDWLGPDLDDVIDAAQQAGIPSMVVVPIGFVTDHMETLYDLDIMAAERALNSGMEFVRGPVANDNPHLIRGLAESILPLL